MTTQKRAAQNRLARMTGRVNIRVYKVREAVTKLKCEIRASIAGARSEWRVTNNARTMMIARIGAALQTLDKDLGL